MKEELKPYQLEGAAFLSASHCAGLFDEPGLGKTAQAIRAAEEVGARKILIICPAGVRQVWPFQIRLWGRGNPKVVKAASIFDVVAWGRGKVDILVVSYQQAVSWQKDLASDFFDALIMDEVHYCKNPETQRTKAILNIAKMSSYVWGLTGTPIKNDPSDLWVMLHLSKATALGYVAFQKRYFRQRIGTFSVTNKVRPEAAAELKRALKSMSIMRTFDDVGEQLPPIRLDMLAIDGEREEITSYLRGYPGLDARIVDSMVNGSGLSFDDSTHIATLRSLIAEAKAPGYAQLITDELKSGTIDKLVVMGHHRKALELVAAHLNAHNIRTEVIVGGVSEARREATVRSFQDDPRGVRVIVGNIEAAGTGLTLTAACRLDMLESSWTPADNVQAVRRVRRMGQKRPTLVRFVMLNNSFDQKVAEIVTRKANTIVSITDKDNMREAMVK